MNWLLIAVAVVLLLSALDGRRKGFIKKSVGLLSLLVTLGCTAAATPYIANLLRDHTGLYQVLQNSIEASDAQWIEVMETLGFEEVVSSYLAEKLLQAVAFLIALLVIGTLLQSLLFSLGIMTRLPVLHGVNKTAGLALGLAEGVLFVWIFFFVATVFSSTLIGGTLLGQVAGSEFLTWLYKKNILLAVLPVS